MINNEHGVVRPNDIMVWKGDVMQANLFGIEHATRIQLSMYYSSGVMNTFIYNIERPGYIEI